MDAGAAVSNPGVSKGRQQRSSFWHQSQTIQPHGVQLLEDVTIFSVKRRSAVCLMKAHDVFEPRDQAFFSRCVAAGAGWRHFDA
jgi:hypothetical protein